MPKYVGTVEWFDILESLPIGTVKVSTFLPQGDFFLKRGEGMGECESCTNPAVWYCSAGMNFCAEHGAEAVAAYAGADYELLGEHDHATKVEFSFER